MRIINPIQDGSDWKPKPAPKLAGIFAVNHLLNEIKEEQQPIEGIDSIEVDQYGMRYASAADGRILQWRQGTKATLYVQLNGSPTGLAADTLGNLFVATADTGLVIQVMPDKTVLQLQNHINGKPINNLNDVAVAHNGAIFATRSTQHWKTEESNKAVVAHLNDGVVYTWSNTDAKPQVLIDNLAYPNGIILSHDQNSVLVAETSEYKVSRVWLRGAKKGKKMVLLDNLPGFASDIVADNDGVHYWLVMFDLRKNMPLLDGLIANRFLRPIFSNLPLNWIPKPVGTPFIVKFNDKGEVVKTMQAGASIKLPGFSSIAQDEDALLMNTIASVSREGTQYPVYRIAKPKSSSKSAPSPLNNTSMTTTTTTTSMPIPTH